MSGFRPHLAAGRLIRGGARDVARGARAGTGRVGGVVDEVLAAVLVAHGVGARAVAVLRAACAFRSSSERARDSSGTNVDNTSNLFSNVGKT